MILEHIFKVVESESILDGQGEPNPYFDVLRHTVEFPKTGAATKQFFTIEHKFFACSVVCLDSQNRILLERIPRFPLRDSEVDAFSWELPGGRSQGSETPMECVQRELREETGLVAGSIEPLLKDYYYPENSFGTEKLYLFIATNTKIESDISPETEGEFHLEWIPLEKAVQMAFSGEIRSSWTIIGILATQLLRNQSKE